MLRVLEIEKSELLLYAGPMQNLFTILNALDDTRAALGYNTNLHRTDPM